MPLIEGLVGVDLTTVTTEYPVLARGIYPFRIAEAKQENSKAGDPMLTLRLELESEARDTKGNVVQPGYVIMHRIGLKPTGKRTAGMVAGDIASLQEAAFGTRVPLDQFDTDSLVNQSITVKTAVDPGDEQYPEATVVASRGFVKKSV